MKYLGLFLLVSMVVSCGVEQTTSSSSSTSSSSVGDCLDSSFGSGVPDWIKNNFDCVQVSVVGSSYKFVTNDVPMHNSAYFPSDHSRYLATMDSGRSVNPNEISAQNYTMYIPISPNTVATTTDMNAIGVATDGVVFYNNQAASPDTLANEVATLDPANGHPTNTGSYHYHINPDEITNDDSNLIGIARDGYAVFGEKCPTDGNLPGVGTSSLDSYNGHTSNTGVTGLGTIYHYHLNDESGDGVSTVIVVGDSYRGSPGTMTNN
ncbi:MAG: hypothetical protein CME65_10955 [Halobacteriovoraceae bacterium]|nr:hypothetical protein [Halobacteriovoraceae bacterium]|tara:strand:+ start:1538 stop:2329 length:792 start_codon:yes stop_codon:yes gene_type:complete